MTPFDGIKQTVSDILTPLGFESHPFQIGWYNELVETQYHLDYPSETLAFSVLSTPGWLRKVLPGDINTDEGVVDMHVQQHFDKVKLAFPNQNIEYIDEKLDASGKAKILVQTAGHEAGAAYYYQRRDITNGPWLSKEKISGVSIHPKYGGWFSFRGVIIFKGVTVPELEKIPPSDVVPDNNRRIELLKRYNFQWQDGTYRDIIDPDARYSKEENLFEGFLCENS